MYKNKVTKCLIWKAKHNKRINPVATSHNRGDRVFQNPAPFSL